MVYCTCIFLLNVRLYVNLFNRGPRGRLAMPNELPSLNKDFHFTSLSLMKTYMILVKVESSGIMLALISVHELSNARGY